MSKYAIQVENLGKEYIIGGAERRYDSFREMLTGALTSPLKKLRKLGGAASEEERFWALKDVSFSVEQGEVLGIIGKNGAGKSTLLKILSRITEPTTGRIVVRGRLASLLEVGTGFHPELTGRENIFLNGAILGMRGIEVARRFDEIVDFADIEKFIDTPVKRYSSGMYVRLAFGVAAHLDTDVLLVDEVLSVGDAAFQRKSLGKMSDVASGGKTVLFVSHNLAAVRSLCGRALVLEQGGLAFTGGVREGLSYYENTYCSSVGRISDSRFRGSLSAYIRFDSLVYKQDGEVVQIVDPLKAFKIEVQAVSLKSFPRLGLKLGIFRDGFHIASCHDTQRETGMHEGPFVSVFDFPGDVLRPGRYTLGIGAWSAMGDWTWGDDVASLDFSENHGDHAADRSEGIVSIPYSGQRIQ